MCCNLGCFEGLCSSFSETERLPCKKTSRLSHLCFSYTTGPTKPSSSGTQSPSPPGSREIVPALPRPIQRHKPVSHRSLETKGRWELSCGETSPRLQHAQQSKAGTPFWDLQSRANISCFLKIWHHSSKSVGNQSFLTAADQRPGWPVWEEKEQIFLKLFSELLRAWVAILSLNGTHLHATTSASYTSPGKQTASQMHPFLSWNIKTGGVILKSLRQCWQLERQLEGWR